MGTTLGQYYIQVMPSAEGITGKLQSILDPEAGSAGESAGKTIGGKIAAVAASAIAALGVGKMISDSITRGMDFETTMAKANTLFSGTGEQFQALQSEILGLSSTYGVAATEFAEAAYSAESASVPMGNIGSMLEGSAKLAVSGFTDIDTALSATAKTMNAYGMMSDDMAATQENMEKVQRVLIQTQNKGITTVGELGASLAQVTPTAAAFGVSFEQVGASLAGMTAQGTPTAQATTQLNSLIAELGKNGTIAANNLLKAAEGTEYAGMSFNEMMDAGLTLNDVLDMMQGLADENNVAMVDMFSSIEAGKAAMSINNSDFVGNLEAMATSADVVGEAFGTMSDTAQFKIDRMKEALKNVGIKAFAASADVVSSALDGISTVLDAVLPPLADLGNAFKDLIGTFASVVAGILGIDQGFSASQVAIEALTTVIDGVTKVLRFLTQHMNTIAPVITTVVGAFVALKAAMAVSSIISGVGAAIGMLASPIGIAVAAIAGIVAAGVALYQNWDVIKEKAAALGNAISEKWNNLKTAATESWEGLKETVSESWDGLKSAAEEKFGMVTETISGAMELARGYAAEKLSGIKTAFDENGGGIQGTVAATMEAIKTYYGLGYDALNTITGGGLDSIRQKTETVWNNLKTFLSTTVDSIKIKIDTVITNIKIFLENTWNTIKTTTETIWNNLNTFLSTLWDAIKTKVETVFNAVKTFLDTTWNNIKSAAVTAWNNIKKEISDKIDAIKKYVEDTLNKMKEAISKIWDNIKSTVVTKWNEIKTEISGKIDAIKELFKLDNFKDLGKNIIGGILAGLKEAASTLLEYARGLVSSVLGVFTGGWKINSPSRVFRDEVGAMISKGLALGIMDGIPEINKAMDFINRDIAVEGVRTYGINENATARGGFVQNITVNAPTELSPSEVARQVKIANQRTALQWRLA